MKFSHLVLLNLLIIGTAGSSSYWLHTYTSRQPISQPLLHRPSFSLPDLTGQLRNNSEWDGKVVIVNFWATWCPPCINEIPMFIELQKHYAQRNVQFLGIAIDNPETVRIFSKRLGINYPVFMDEEKAIEIAQKFGNYLGALPFTAIINPKGDIVFRSPGELDQKKLEQIIFSLL